MPWDPLELSTKARLAFNSCSFAWSEFLLERNVFVNWMPFNAIKDLAQVAMNETLFCFAGLGEIPDFILGQPLLEAGNICTNAVVQVWNVPKQAHSHPQTTLCFASPARGVLHGFWQGTTQDRFCTIERMLKADAVPCRLACWWINHT